MLTLPLTVWICCCTNAEKVTFMGKHFCLHVACTNESVLYFYLSNWGTPHTWVHITDLEVHFLDASAKGMSTTLQIATEIYWIYNCLWNIKWWINYIQKRIYWLGISCMKPSQVAKRNTIDSLQRFWNTDHLIWLSTWKTWPSRQCIGDVTHVQCIGDVTKTFSHWSLPVTHGARLQENRHVKTCLPCQ